MTEEMNSITTTITASEDGKHTFEIQKVLEDAEGKTAVIIELYPTLTAKDINKMDISTLHLMNHVEELGWKEVKIINLFSTVFDRKPLAAKLQFDLENLTYFEDMLDALDSRVFDFVIAWGTTLENNKAAKEMKRQFLALLEQRGLEKQVMQFSVDSLETQKQLSPHPLYLGLRHAKETWKLVPFPLQSILKELMPKPEKKTEEKKAEGKTPVAEKETKQTEARKQKKGTGKPQIKPEDKNFKKPPEKVQTGTEDNKAEEEPKKENGKSAENMTA